MTLLQRIEDRLINWLELDEKLIGDKICERIEKNWIGDWRKLNGN